MAREVDSGSRQIAKPLGLESTIIEEGSQDMISQGSPDSREHQNGGSLYHTMFLKEEPTPGSAPQLESGGERCQNECGSGAETAVYNSAYQSSREVNVL